MPMMSVMAATHSAMPPLTSNISQQETAVPNTLSEAITFLETQWPSNNENKMKGILAELRLKEFLTQHNHHFISGGWIMIPGTTSRSETPTLDKLCILPRKHSFTWEDTNNNRNSLSLAELSAYNYFRQVGLTVLFANPVDIDETQFELPSPAVGRVRAKYPRSYELQLQKVSNTGLTTVTTEDAFSRFPQRNGNRGIQCKRTNWIPQGNAPWNHPSLVSDLFWFEYSRYFFKVNYLISNNDLDLFIIGSSGASYPVELKSKTPANDPSLGDWFGIDMGPFAKLSFFTSNAMNTDALYVVEEVDNDGNHLEWYGIKFTDLVKSCSWVGRSGGQGMTGSASSTYKIPKSAFSSLHDLMDAI